MKGNNPIFLRQVILDHCLHCCGGDIEIVARCCGDKGDLPPCPLFEVKETPCTEKEAAKAIKHMCLYCSGNVRKEVADCWDTECGLHPYR